MKTVKIIAVLLVLLADAAYNVIGAFWGFSMLALALVFVLFQTSAMAVKSSVKTYTTEQRLNAAIKKLPVQQTTPGPFTGNNSYDISRSFDNADGGVTGGGADGGSVTHPVGGAPTDHWHNVVGPGAQHGHYYGQIALDFNALRDSFSNLVVSYNQLVVKLQQANVLK